MGKRFCIGRLVQSAGFTHLYSDFSPPSAVFLVVIYLNGIRIELPMSYAGYKGFRSRYPIKLLYVSNLPVIFASALFANVYFFSQLLWSTQGRPAPGHSLLFQIIGQFNVTQLRHSYQPTSRRLAYLRYCSS